MKRKLLSAMTITALLTALLGGGSLVYADSHADAEATAGGKGASTDVYACHDAYAEAYAETEDDSSASIDEGYTDTGITSSYVYAEATSKGGGYAHADVSVYVGDVPYEGKIYGYAVANSSGSNSWALSDINIDYVIPAGSYIDVDAMGGSYAIALLLSDGSTVWGIAMTSANGGEDAYAWIDTECGVNVGAMVGEEISS